MFVAKPFLNNNKDMKEFDCIKDAIKYLEDITGYEMSFELDRKKKKKLIKSCLLYTSPRPRDTA